MPFPLSRYAPENMDASIPVVIANLAGGVADNPSRRESATPLPGPRRRAAEPPDNGTTPGMRRQRASKRPSRIMVTFTPR